MYDFYKNPPKTKQDIRDFLTSWLQKVDDTSPLVIEGETFVQELGFRLQFCIHCVFRSTVTNEYVWWVMDPSDESQFPTKRYPTYEALLEGVINDYYTRWKLNE